MIYKAPESQKESVLWLT